MFSVSLDTILVPMACLATPKVENFIQNGQAVDAFAIAIDYRVDHYESGNRDNRMLHFVFHRHGQGMRVFCAASNGIFDAPSEQAPDTFEMTSAHVTCWRTSGFSLANSVIRDLRRKLGFDDLSERIFIGCAEKVQITFNNANKGDNYKKALTSIKFVEKLQTF